MVCRVFLPDYAGHIAGVPCLAGAPDEPASAPLSADCFAIACRAMGDMVLLAHIREQHRLSLESYGWPRMTEELQELNLNVGHRRVGRLMRENGIKIVRTQKYKATTIARRAIAKQSAERGTAITRSTLRPICWIRTSQLMAPTKNGLETSATSGPAKVGCIWPLSLICILVASSPSHGLQGQTTVR
jgi:hypothetical protein